MGYAASKVKVYRNTASPSDRSVKSCVTDALDRFTDYDTLWEHLVDLTKHPMETKGLKEQAVTQISENELIVTKTLDLIKLDGQVMDELGLQRILFMDEHKLTEWTKQDTSFSERYKIDSAGGRVSAERYGPAGDLLETSWTVVHRDPLRVEFWVDMAGNRRCGCFVMEAARAKLLNPAIKRVHGDGYMWQMFVGQWQNKDFLGDCRPSLSHPGEMSVVSEPLDAFIDFETLWFATVDVLRYPEPQPGKEWELTDVEQISETELKVTRRYNPDDPRVEGLEPNETWDRIVLDRSNGIVRADTFNDSGLCVITWYKIHKDPVRVECWCEGPPQRKSGIFVKQRLLRTMGIILDRCECAAGLDGNIESFMDLQGFEDAEEEPLLPEEPEEPWAEEEPGPAWPAEHEAPVLAPSARDGQAGPSRILLAWRARKAQEEEEKRREKQEKEAAELAERARQMRLQSEKDTRQEDEKKEDEKKAKSSDEYFECQD
mmetsp:Transcript_69335/g.224149  ORF Transcript_69335/g.224149 Transcript_69335/m.224149 type:complete len:488 (-) Transcript_69335:122-1585(-)